MNTPVSFETAKLLKEKGYDEYCNQKYIAQCLWQKPNSREKYKNSEIHKNSNDVSAPTIAEVVMWLYEKHKLDIIVRYPDSDTNKVEGINSVYYNLEIYRLSGGDAWKKYKKIGVSDNKTEVYEAGIIYCLNNLI